MHFFIRTFNVLISLMITGLLAFSTLQLRAADWFAVADLRGTWQFTVGDDPKWADPNISTSDWDLLPVPGRWESRYPGYNGYAWYRRTFNLNMIPQKATVTLFLGYIDDADEVFINGQKVGQSGGFFPNYHTAFDTERQYKVPVSLLKRTGNVIAVRVYDEYKDGGIVRAGKNFGLYYDREMDLLSIDLSGPWKFSTTPFENVHSFNFHDNSWEELLVPMPWETQGYPGHDGIAFYRKRFLVPDNLLGKQLYLVLGKIDDFDKVYLNGRLIGQTEKLDQYSWFRRDQAYNLMRIYKIPAGLLRNKNVVSVEVNDLHGIGGIYEGPVGIATYDAALKIGQKHRERNFGDWDFSIWNLIDLFN